MSTIDPYYFFLGIPPKHQPPDHYRLLGVERFEEDAEIIEVAADRQMRHLQYHESGDRADEVTKLLGEVSRARLCLLNPEKKAGYDATLRTLIQGKSNVTASATPAVVDQDNRDFDPYHKWMGIPAHEQPPNHYRLLRIGLFESDSEVIKNAFERETAGLKMQQDGQHADHAARISRELLKARDCLLDADRKQRYDATLQEKLDAEEEGDDLADELEQRIAVDQAVKQATAELTAKRNQLRSRAKQAALREQRALDAIQQLKQRLATASRRTNTPGSKAVQPRSPVRQERSVGQQIPVRQERAWVFPVVVASAALAFALVLITVIAISASNNRSKPSAKGGTAQNNDGEVAAAVTRNSEGPEVKAAPYSELTSRSTTIVAPRVKAIDSPSVDLESSPATSVRDGTQTGEVQDNNGLKMQLCWCPAGSFSMGSPKREAGRDVNEDAVNVTLTRGFWLGKYEVTQQQWMQIMHTVPWRGESNVKEGLNHPAMYVNWEDATEFCKRLTEQDRSAGLLSMKWKYTLPTEAQWEYACRAGTTTRFSFQEFALQLGDFAWFKKNAYDAQEQHAHEVGTKRPNAWGLHDMHGNLREWCRDSYLEHLPGGTNPEGTSIGSTRVIRGGSWYDDADDCRSATRDRFSAIRRYSFVGFRVAAVLEDR